MDEALHGLIKRDCPGLAAWGARLPDRSLRSGSRVPWLPLQHVERALLRLAIAADSFGKDRSHPVHIRWTFEHVRVSLILRPDGAFLALFLQNRPDLPATAAEALLQDFGAL